MRKLVHRSPGGAGRCYLGGRKSKRTGALLSAGHNGFIMLMSAMGVPQVIVCASFHDVHRVRIVS
jgi:hypothetical protein